MSLLARSKPYPTRTSETYTCTRCGIEKTSRMKTPPTHCMDCRPYKKETQQ